MSISLYDNALVAKIKSWLPDQLNIHVLKPDEVTKLLQVKADEQNDQPLSLPIISVARDKDFTLKINTSRNMSRDGLSISSVNRGVAIPQNPKIMQLNAIPIELNYQIDIYTYYFREADALLRELIFNLVNSPKLEVEIPYNNANITQVCNIRVSPTIVDNSDIPQNIQGQFTRWTINLRLDDAYLYSLPINKAAKMADTELEIHSKDINSTSEEIELIGSDNK